MRTVRAENTPDTPAALPPDHGRWQVTTETSTYLLDFDLQTALRVPDSGAGAADARPSSLRGDHLPVRLLRLAALQIGRPMVLYVSLEDPDIITIRRTTVVVGVHAIDAAGNAPRPPDDGQRGFDAVGLVHDQDWYAAFDDRGEP